MADIEWLIRRWNQARDHRANFDSVFQQIADRVLPQAADFRTQREIGARRTELMFDATAYQANFKFASAVGSFTIPNSSKWHGLATDDDELNKLLPVKQYFEEVTAVLFRKRYASAANFAGQAHGSLLQYGAFGTSALFIDEAYPGQPRYRAMPLARTYVLENAAGLIDTCIRQLPMSARQIMQLCEGFGAPDVVPAKVRQSFEKEPDLVQWEVLHMVSPRERFDPYTPGGLNMPWQSCYFMEAPDKVKLHEGGYTTWPFAFGRFVTSPGEVYGRSPAWMALANVKVLNEQKKTSLKAAHKVADPPLLAAEENALAPFSMVPGYINYGSMTQDGKPLVMPLQSNARLDITLEMMDKEREIIASGFLLDVFRVLVENPQMTATQALELLNERANIIAPVIGLLQTEQLGAMVEREYALCQMAGELPDPPPELIEAGAEYKTVYTAPINRAMRASDGVAIVRTLEAITPIAQVDPKVLDAFDLPMSARELADIYGYPAKALRSVDDLKRLAAQRSQEAEVGALVEAAPSVTAAAANLVKMQQNLGQPTA